MCNIIHVAFSMCVHAELKLIKFFGCEFEIYLNFYRNYYNRLFTSTLFNSILNVYIYIYSHRHIIIYNEIYEYIATFKIHIYI